MDLPDNTWTVGAIFVLGAVMALLVGLRVHSDENVEEFLPLYIVMNFWVWLTLVVLVASGIGVAVFLVSTTQLRSVSN